MKRYVGDFGPIYAETNPGIFPVEPWNTVSTLIFLFLVLLYGKKTRADFKSFPFTVVSLPVLLVGFVGGAVYHATRSHWIWLVLDFGPIFLLVLFAMFYFWKLLTGSRLWAGVVVISLFAMAAFVRSQIEGSLTFKISVGYTLMALNVLLPICLYAAKRRWQGGGLLLVAVSSFSFALIFRYFDHTLSQSVFPMGTHFLWHILGGVSVWALLEYIYRTEAEG